MNPDDLQQAWRSQTTQTRITVDVDLLLQEFQRNQRTFLATILRRDCVEIGVGLLLLPVWFYLGAKLSLPWTWYLTVPAILWTIGFFLVDRRLHPQTPSPPGEPLVDFVRNSLAQVEHQIWLLRNVHWWYLLPYTIAILAFFVQISLRKSDSLLAGIVSLTVLSGFVLLLYALVYWVNQVAVRKLLEPRRREMLALLTGLGTDEAEEKS